MIQDISPKAKTPRDELKISVISYLIIAAVGTRGFLEYSDKRLWVAALMGGFFVILVLKRIAAENLKVFGAVYLVIQILLMAALNYVTPAGDYWALTLLPACIFVMRYYPKRIGFIWIGIFTAVMIGILIYTHEIPWAFQYIIIYLAAYGLVSFYSLALKQTDTARQESQQLLIRLREANERLRANAGQVEELAVIKERNRLARELHDSVTQVLFSINLLSKSALMLMDRDQRKAREKLEQLQPLSNEALKEMRDLIYQLRPLSVAENGLLPVLRRHFDETEKRDGLTVELRAETEPIPGTPVQLQEIYRIIQEAVNNIIKHAGTDRARVEIQERDGTLYIEITDDGKGWDQSADAEMGGHFGLKNMRERVKELKGAIGIRSAPGRGTSISIEIPVTAPEGKA